MLTCQVLGIFNSNDIALSNLISNENSFGIILLRIFWDKIFLNDTAQGKPLAAICMISNLYNIRPSFSMLITSRVD